MDARLFHSGTYFTHCKCRNVLLQLTNGRAVTIIKRLCLRCGGTNKHCSVYGLFTVDSVE